MATTTPNFGWPVPTSTDLVKDGATAMEALGDAIDTSMVDLKGGTTGQVLAKASNTDMDFSWVAQDDSNAIQNTIVDAKGDLIAASAADTPARLAVGNNGETLVADSSTATGLRYNANFAAGKNKILNGDFNIWQRGTSSSANGYLADRWVLNYSVPPTSFTQSRQTFTPGTAPVAGYEGRYFWRYAITTVGSNTDMYIGQLIEDVTTFAGQTMTFSIWLKADSARSVSLSYNQVFGSGGSGSVSAQVATYSVTTSWTRFSTTIAIPSISGKTIGTSSYLQFFLTATPASGFSLDCWGVQAEAGSVATAFQTATGTIQGELLACKRYCQNINFAIGGKSNYNTVGQGMAIATTGARVSVNFPAPMRSTPSSVTYTAGAFVLDNYTAAPTVTNVTLNQGGADFALINVDATAGGLTFRDVVLMYANNNSSANLIFSAEL